MKAKQPLDMKKKRCQQYFCNDGQLTLLISGRKKMRFCFKVFGLNFGKPLFLSIFYFFISDYLTNSNILAGNTFYQIRLQEFLKPAVGGHPQWVLCYRASTNGWAARTFHSRCDRKRDTVTIIKKGQYVFGGYTDIPWGK